MTHEHLDCPPDQRKWMERKLHQAATMKSHTFCLTCGKVKNLDGPRGRKLGFYMSGLSALKEYLGRSAKDGKMTQSQSHLITTIIEGLDDFEDPYGMSVEVQARHYVEAVRTVRPDLDDELILRLLPKVRRKSRQPLVGIMTRVSAS